MYGIFGIGALLMNILVFINVIKNYKSKYEIGYIWKEEENK